MFGKFIQENPTESMFIGIIIVLLIWYYFMVYKKGKTLHDVLFNKKVVVSAPLPPPSSAPVKTEEFQDNISSHINPFHEDSLKQLLH